MFYQQGEKSLSAVLRRQELSRAARKAGSRSDSSLSLHTGCPHKSKHWGQAKAQPRAWNNKLGEAITHPSFREIHRSQSSTWVATPHPLAASLAAPDGQGQELILHHRLLLCLHDLAAPWTSSRIEGKSWSRVFLHWIFTQCLSCKLNEAKREKLSRDSKHKNAFAAFMSDFKDMPGFGAHKCCCWVQAGEGCCAHYAQLSNTCRKILQQCYLQCQTILILETTQSCILIISFFFLFFYWGLKQNILMSPPPKIRFKLFSWERIKNERS